MAQREAHKNWVIHGVKKSAQTEETTKIMMIHSLAKVSTAISAVFALCFVTSSPRSNINSLETQVKRCMHFCCHCPSVVLYSFILCWEWTCNSHSESQPKNFAWE